MQKKTLGLLLFLLSFAFAVPAQELKGVWAGAFENDEVFAAIRLNFDESNIVLSFGGSERPGAIKDVKSANGEVTFTAELQPKAVFTGKIEAGKISGTFDMFRRDGTKSGSGVWNARNVDSLNFTDDSTIALSTEKIELPAPTGKFAIGRQFFYWTDETRSETITDAPGDKRRVFVQIWYPAKKGGTAPAEYYPNLLEMSGKSERNDFLSQVKTHAVQNTGLAVSQKPFPVIVFSPGLGSSPFGYTAIIEDLVSRGYVVAAINHPYDSGDFKFSDGQIIRFDEGKWNREVSKDYTAEQRKQFFDERRFGWAKDISFVVNQLEKIGKPFAGKLDLQNLGLFGHSFGGQAVSVACASDKRFKACANLDGMAQGNVVLPDEKGGRLTQPFLFFNKSAEVTNAELKMMNLTRSEYRTRERRRLVERWKPSFKTQLAEISSGAYFVLYPGVKHSSFADSLVLNTDAKDPLFASRYEIARNINDFVLAFFDKFLLKKPSPLLDGKTQMRPPVVVEFLKKTP